MKVFICNLCYNILEYFSDIKDILVQISDSRTTKSLRKIKEKIRHMNWHGDLFFITSVIKSKLELIG